MSVLGMGAANKGGRNILEGVTPPHPIIGDMCACVCLHTCVHMFYLECVCVQLQCQFLLVMELSSVHTVKYDCLIAT